MSPKNTLVLQNTLDTGGNVRESWYHGDLSLAGIARRIMELRIIDIVEPFDCT